MEFLVVNFREARNVVIDGVDIGQQANMVIEAEGGHHVITLSGNVDYTPSSQEVILEDTSELAPAEIYFS